MLFQTDKSDISTRLDLFLVEKMPELSRSNIQKQIEDKNILVNDCSIAKNYKIKHGDVINVSIVEPVELSVIAQEIPLDIIYEDDSFLIINKEKGMVVHPANGNHDNTLVNALMFHCKDLSGINGVIRPGIVHRIDKNTSGLLVVAKNDISHTSLAAQIKEHKCLREYQTIVYGNVKEDEGIIDLPIGRHQNDRKKMCVTNKNAKNAVTHFTVIKRYQGFTHLSLRLETGRTHQIRVHLAYMCNPVAGDDVYGPKKVIKKLDGQCLHAKSIGFKHPITGEEKLFDCELPKYFTDFLGTLKDL